MSAPSTPEAASALGYVVAESYDVAEVVGFVRGELGQRTGWLYAHSAIILVLLTIGALALYGDWAAGRSLLRDVVVPLGAGLLATILLVVPHELLHGITFRLQGAPRVVYGADWRRLVFHASAPGFVLDYRRMRVVALAPFAIISVALGTALSQLDGPGWWVAYAALLAHTQGCLGDAAILNAFERRSRPHAWLTYDDPHEPRFVFLRKRLTRTETGATES